VTLSHKIAKFFQAEFYRRTWRRIQRFVHPISMRSLLHRIDQQRLRILEERHGSPPPDAPESWRHYAKYLNLKKWLRINVRRVQDLNLHRAAPQDILDIGCGPGFFLFVAQSRGHRGLGLDIPGMPIFDDLVELFGVERIIHRIEMLQPLPDLGRKFDLITAFSTAFHGGGKLSGRWGPREWDFFISDLERHLKPGGRIFFGLNPAYDGNFYTPEILDLFLRHGAKVERERVLFPPESSKRN